MALYGLKIKHVGKRSCRTLQITDMVSSVTPPNGQWVISQDCKAEIAFEIRRDISHWAITYNLLTINSSVFKTASDLFPVMVI